MEQYIRKSAVVAEIENLLDKGKHHDAYQCAYRDGNNGALYALKNKLDTIEVKEVNLVKEYDDFQDPTLARLVNRNAGIVIAKHFFELKESEDEKIRKALINGFKDYKGWDEEWFDGITVRETIAWLEKQGEQKSDAWSKEDEDYYDAIIAKLEVTQDDAALTDNQIEFLKSLKYNLQSQHKQEPKWDEEDNNYIDNCCLLIGAVDDTYDKIFKDNCIHYLLSLKERFGESL